MKFKMTKMLCLICFISAALIPSILFAQQAAEKTAQPAAEKTAQPAATQSKEQSNKARSNPRDEYAPDQRPEENYLARFKAIDVSQRLMRENLENIYMLKVIVSNFKDQGWDKDYSVIYDEYKKAVSKYYRRQVVYSQLELEKNRKHINDLFKKIVVVYEDQANVMMDECADKILNFDMDERNKLDPNRNRTLFQNTMRLWIAYGQMDDADSSSLDNQFKASVYHLRIAKAYAIQILEQLSPEGVGEKYRIHKADNLNRVLTAEAAKTTAPGPQTSPATVK
jgi:hypothetical protein